MRLVTAGLLLAFTSSMAFAEAFDTKPMNDGLNMLESSAKNALTKYGIEADVMTLTLVQLGQISGILSNSSEETEKKRDLEAIIRP